MIPDYQTLMRPVLECASSGGEVKISDVVELLAKKLDLTAEERAAILPSGKQTRFANRVNWAKSYLKQGGLVEITGRGRFKITDRGRAALADCVIHAMSVHSFTACRSSVSRDAGHRFHAMPVQHFTACRSSS